MVEKRRKEGRRGGIVGEEKGGGWCRSRAKGERAWEIGAGESRRSRSTNGLPDFPRNYVFRPNSRRTGVKEAELGEKTAGTVNRHR